ncbi:MAG: NUDIX domain-containing protein [Ignavibacteriaceae bacterium]|nr:MAG: NUDIX domain-containing protein [Ignavibacteriaceae bacterium]
MKKHELLEKYEGFTRVRASAILIEKKSILLVRQQSMFDESIVNLMPPGGGVGFQETLHDAVIRECFEETGLTVKPERLLYINEFVYDKVHAVEFYFLVTRSDEKKPEIGSDPELPAEKQILKEVLWVPLSEVAVSSFSPEKMGRLLNEHAESGFNHHPFWLNGD